MKALLVLYVVLLVLVAPVAAKPTSAKPALHVGYDAEHLDLDKRTLQFTLSQPAARATLTAIGEDGAELGTGTATYDAPPPGKWLPITWTQPSDTRVLKLQLRAEAVSGATVNLELIPWSVTVDHEDVNFATNSAAIADSERAKLEASIEAIRAIVQRSEKFVKMQLYVAGHTDTVGPAAKNRRLSLARAQAIGRYFRDHGVAMPIVVAGFGEDVLKLPTADNTDADVNRRADYVIGPRGGQPPFSGSYLKARAVWTPRLQSPRP